MIIDHRNNKSFISNVNNKLIPTITGSISKLNPAYLIKYNPVMFLVEVCFFIVDAIVLFPRLFVGVTTQSENLYIIIAIILILTVWLSTFSESLAEGQAKDRIKSLQNLEREIQAHLIVGDTEKIIRSQELKVGDIIRVGIKEYIPRDGIIKEGKTFMDESMMTGESNPVYREKGDSVIGGTRVVADTIFVEITAESGKSFLDQMMTLVQGAKRPKTQNEISLNILLIGLTLILLTTIGSFFVLAILLNYPIDLAIVLSLLVALLPTTIGGLLPAIGIAGINRVGKANVIAKSGKAVEAAGDCDIVILDKTGTITTGQRRVIEFIPLIGFNIEDIALTGYFASIHDTTPEGKSIVELASSLFTYHEIPIEILVGKPIEFSAETRISGIELMIRKNIQINLNGNSNSTSLAKKEPKVISLLKELEKKQDNIKILKGEVDAIFAQASDVNEAELRWKAQKISIEGGTPLAISIGNVIIGLANLRDSLKPNIRNKLDEVKSTGIKTVMVTGDNKITAQVIANEAGIDEFIAHAKPFDKLHKVEEEQSVGRVVGVVGDGTNDALALAKADVGMAMNNGTTAAKDASSMVDLDSDPSKILKIVEVGKQLLMTRGVVTTFSVANDVAKYFTIFPALLPTNSFARFLNIMHLTTPTTAIISTLIFNALVNPLLIPLSLRGVKFRAEPTEKTYIRNMLIYGIGGAIFPFLAIKFLDIFVSIFIR